MSPALQPNGLKGSSHLIWLPPLAQWLVPDIGHMICMIQTGPSQLSPRTFQRGATEIHTYFLLFGCGSLRMCVQSRQCLPWRDRETTWGCWCLWVQSFLRSASSCLSYSSALWVNRFIHFLRHKLGFSLMGKKSSNWRYQWNIFLFVFLPKRQYAVIEGMLVWKQH